MAPWALLIASLVVSAAKACPEFCTCFDHTFVACSNFNVLDMALLPHATDTLVLSSGEVDELPMGFLVMARRLKMLEISKLRVRVVRQGAFRGLANLEKFSITDSTFDIVEPESFSGLSSIEEFELISSHFGRVGKHAFSSLRNIRKLTIWLSSFGSMADEAFFGMHDVTSLQIYNNNITYLGKSIFKGSKKLEEIVFDGNSIDLLSESSLGDLFTASENAFVTKNTFPCSCELTWVLSHPGMLDNACVFPGQSFSKQERLFQLRDMTEEVLCSAAQVAHATAEATTRSGSDDLYSDNDDRYELGPTIHSEEVGHLASSGNNASYPQILSMGETFDHDLDNIDHFVFENILTPALRTNNESSQQSSERSSLEGGDVLPGFDKEDHEGVITIGSAQGVKNRSVSAEDVRGDDLDGVLLVGGKRFTGGGHSVGDFIGTDTSTEDELSENINVAGEYAPTSTISSATIEIDLETATQEEPAPLTTRHREITTTTTELTVVAWEQESVYFDQKTSLSSENEDLESEKPDLEHEDHIDVDDSGATKIVVDKHSLAASAERQHQTIPAPSSGVDDYELVHSARGEDSHENEVDRSPPVSKMALAVSGKVNGQSRQNVQKLEDDSRRERSKSANNFKMRFQSSFLCVLASCLFCILHWLVLV